MEKSVFVKSILVKSADQIVKVSECSIKEYEDKTEILVAKMNEVMLKREDILLLIGGEKNIKMMKENHTSHLRFVASILQTPNSETLVDTLLWVFRTFMSRGFTSKYWEVQIKTLVELLKENVSENSLIEILSIYNWINVNIPQFVLGKDEKIKM